MKVQPGRQCGTLVLGLGSNLGDREDSLRRAIGQLQDLWGPLTVAPFYLSHPISPVPQPDYLNTVAIAPIPAGRDSLEAARDLLERLKELEEWAGRRPGGPRFGPRPLDLDILLYGDLVHRDPAPSPAEASGGSRWLELPHPRLRQRRFVLAPLNDLAPDLEVPPDGIAVHRLLRELGTDQAITKVG